MARTTITEYQKQQLALLENIDTTLRNLLIETEKRGQLTENAIKIEGSVLSTEEPTEEKVEEFFDTTPHISIAQQYLGFDEDTHNEKLKEFMGINPSHVSWCAVFGGTCLKNAGILNKTSMVAKDYDNGMKVSKPKKGDMCIHRNHFSFFYGYADKAKLALLENYGKVHSLEDWELVTCDFRDDVNVVEMVLGGNQSDEVNISPKEWYDNYSKFLGYFRILSLIHI